MRDRRQAEADERERAEREQVFKGPAPATEESKP
jgi:hypothetical protein